MPGSLDRPSYYVGDLYGAKSGRTIGNDRRYQGRALLHLGENEELKLRNLSLMRSRTLILWRLFFARRAKNNLQKKESTMLPQAKGTV